MPEDRGRGRAQPVSVGPRRRVMSRADRARADRNRRRRRTATRLTISLLVGVVIAAAFLGSKLLHSMSGPVTDYRGDGKEDLVIEVHPGDSTTAIGETLHSHGVVATVKAFVDAASGNAKISAIQPGFYRTRTEIPAASAVRRLVDPEDRVGRLVIPEGRQLDDTADMKTDAVTPGIFTLISEASCVELNGDRHCVQAEDLRTAARNGPAVTRSIPPWASQRAAAMRDDHRRVEGLIAPGTWNVDPSASAGDVLATLITSGAESYAESGLPESDITVAPPQLSPYDVLVVASLVQREAKPQDFAKVARVIYNRLEQHRSLEFDSTVNYPLDRREVATTDADRAQHTPWNTYLLRELPATPICSPGDEALRAAVQPEPGDWVYFVTIDNQGTTLFTHDYQQHLANIELAKRNGVLDSSR